MTSVPPQSRDLLIVGLGWAGACVSRAALQAGLKVCVVDPEEGETASRIAGGVIDPISGKKLTPTWRGREFFESAREFYQIWQRDLGASFYREAPILRSFIDLPQAQLFSDRSEDLKKAGIGLRSWRAGNTDDMSRALGFRTEAGAAFTEPGAWVHTEALLDAWKAHLRAEGAFVSARVAPGDLQAAPEGGWLWQGQLFQQVVLCGGAALSDWPELAQQPWGRTAGEVLDLELSGVSSQQVTKRKFQLIPLEGQRFRWGGTYRNRPTDCLPSQEGRDALTSGLEDLLGVEAMAEASATQVGPNEGQSLARGAAQPTARVRAHRAAYRGNLRDHLPLVGRMPGGEGRPPVWVLGALGSKGALWAPLCAKLLVAQLTGQGASEPGWERLGPRQNG